MSYDRTRPRSRKARDDAAALFRDPRWSLVNDLLVRRVVREMDVPELMGAPDDRGGPAFKREKSISTEMESNRAFAITGLPLVYVAYTGASV